jgi:hypothetical protein
MPPSITFLFVVNGPAVEGRKSAWIGFDKAYIKRRDGLARCIAAALWNNTLSHGASSDRIAPEASTFEGAQCWLLYEDESTLIQLDSKSFVARCKNATEYEILNALEKAAKGEINGCTKIKGTSVAELAATIFKGLDAPSTVVVELHGKCSLTSFISNGLAVTKPFIFPPDSFSKMLPVYPDGNTGCQVESDVPTSLSPFVVLGCVQDHLSTITTLLSTANAASFPVQQVTTTMNFLFSPLTFLSHLPSDQLGSCS